MHSKRKIAVLAIFAVALVAISSCEKLLPPAPDANEVLDGPVDGLTEAQTLQFLSGDAAFNDQIFTPETGLGPIFVSTSCGSCHAGDGRGHPFTTLTRFGEFDSTGNIYATLGGPQVQNRAIPGYDPEIIPSTMPHSNITPPPNTGLGYLEAVTDAYLLSLEDPNDANGDGISGVVNWVNAPSFLSPNPNAILLNGKYIGRFGRKAAAIDLVHQTVNAYVQDMGITSGYFPHELFHFNTGAYCNDAVPDPEVSTADVNNVVFYLRSLKAPLRRNTDNADVMAGEALFSSLNCSGCHMPAMQTGNSPITALSNTTFHPYTDLLLHDMGPGLDDGYTEGGATYAEWRTPPLWGLGLSKNSSGGTYYLLHDGRAHSIADAITLHGGEAQNSRNAFVALSQAEKDQLIRFLESL